MREICIIVNCIQWAQKYWSRLRGGSSQGKFLKRGTTVLQYKRTTALQYKRGTTALQYKGELLHYSMRGGLLHYNISGGLFIIVQAIHR